MGVSLYENSNTHQTCCSFYGSAMVCYILIAQRLFPGFIIQIYSIDRMADFFSWPALITGQPFHFRKGNPDLFLSLPVYTIPWEKVKHAIYVHTWRDPRTRYHWGPVHGQIIYVTLKGGIRFWPELDIRIFHKLRHPFSTVCLWLPDKNVRLFTENFEHFYPELERQTQQSGQNLESTYRNRHY